MTTTTRPIWADKHPRRDVRVAHLIGARFHELSRKRPMVKVTVSAQRNLSSTSVYLGRAIGVASASGGTEVLVIEQAVSGAVVLGLLVGGAVRVWEWAI
jgi:hypothetical protein